MSRMTIRGLLLLLLLAAAAIAAGAALAAAIGDDDPPSPEASDESGTAASRGSDEPGTAASQGSDTADPQPPAVGSSGGSEDAGASQADASGPHDSVSTSDRQESASDVADYWTPERMREARPAMPGAPAGAAPPAQSDPPDEPPGTVDGGPPAAGATGDRP